MSKIRIFLTLTGYQFTWLACVFGENRFNEPLLGIYVGCIFLTIYLFDFNITIMLPVIEILQSSGSIEFA